MLVLSRKPGQRVHVGDAVVTVLESTGEDIRLGFDVPQDMLVIREEMMKDQQTSSVNGTSHPDGG